MLADVFLSQLNATDETSKILSIRARERIRAYPWPGNVRELRNELHRAFIMADSTIDLEDLAARRQYAKDPAQTSDVSGSLGDAERQHILATLENCGGDKRKAAEILGISLKTLYNRLHLYQAT
jgi:DNA-binding NtrC family response regulator